ncbi:MAG: methylated-DNA--[protein]-cysteine S-methyltransferase [Bacteroidales bacterium]|jgi:AraC family transcriptional regulator of adaptative response/methylated-DNA-[protein]-cysteine methyltransferase|nr:methylated-DNA--[protein]-cysteine S-methyltransferase [Bacteroidales bacterium]
MLITNKNDFNKYYDAVVNKNSEFIGIFFTCVKTTGIFCIPTCSARKPKAKNVEFYTTSNECLQQGYRPCKICKPTNNAYEPPAEIKAALTLINKNPYQKVTDYILKQNGIQPEKIRRWFKKNHGMTFQAYQRMVRINSAFQELKQGKDVTDSAFDQGYESLSGFGYSFKNIVGSSPKNSSDKNIIVINRITTPLGPMFACATDRGICLLEFTDRRMLETEFHDLQKRYNAIILTGNNPHLKQLNRELDEYFDGKRDTFSVQLDIKGTGFQIKAWQELQNILYGETRSYQQQADILGIPNTVRAVATANGKNRIAIIVPCHRLTGKNGELKGYGGGIERKQWLLNHEANNRDNFTNNQNI